MKFFVKDFCETVQAREVIFGNQVDNDVLYRGIANQPSHAYSVDKIFQCNHSIEDQNLHLWQDVVSLSVFQCTFTQQTIPSTGWLSKLVCK